jgi:hypothetical protein
MVPDSVFGSHCALTAVPCKIGELAEKFAHPILAERLFKRDVRTGETARHIEHLTSLVVVADVVGGWLDLAGHNRKAMARQRMVRQLHLIVHFGRLDQRRGRVEIRQRKLVAENREVAE